MDTWKHNKGFQTPKRKRSIVGFNTLDHGDAIEKMMDERILDEYETNHSETSEEGLPGKDET